MNYHWNWSVLVQQPYETWLLSGIALTLVISGAAWIMAFALGTVIGIMRYSPGRTSTLIARAYVSVFRNIPLLVQMFLWFFVLPEILPRAAGDWLKRGLPDPHIWTAIVCLGFYTSVRIAEQVRAGLAAVGRRQMEAALSVGLTRPSAEIHTLTGRLSATTAGSYERGPQHH